MDILLSLLSLLLLVGTSSLFGFLIWRSLNLPINNCLTSELTIGLALSGYLLLVLASFRLLNLSVILLLFTSLSVINILLQKERLLFLLTSTFNSLKLESIWRLPGWILLIILMLAAVVEALAPSTTSDALSYHLRIPYDYVKEGGLIYSPFQPYNMPHLLQMLVTVPFVIGAGDIGAHLVYFIFCTLLISALFLFTKQFFDRDTALLAIILLVSTPMFSYIKVSGRVEVGLTAVIIMGIWALLNGLNDIGKFRNRWLLISGAFIGIACGIKYYGLFAGITAFILITIVSLRQSDCSTAFKSVLFFSIGVIVLGLPFYVKNLVMTGNPLFPALFDIFGGRDWSAEMAAAASSYYDSYKRPAGEGLLDLLLSPWRLTMDGERFIAGRTGYGFIYLALLPLLFWSVFRYVKLEGFRALLPTNSVSSILGWFIIFLWLLWFLLAFQRGRHLLPVFALLSILTANTCLTWIKQSGLFYGARVINYGIGMVLACGITFQIIVAGYFTKIFIPVVSGYETKLAFLERIRPMWKDYQVINLLLSPDSKVLHLFGDRQYYLKHKQFYPSPYFQGWVDWVTLTDVQAYRNQLKKAGFTHVIGSNYGDFKSDKKLVNIKEKNNINKFKEINKELLKNYTKKIYENVRSIPVSRSNTTKRKEKSFVLYELM